MRKTIVFLVFVLVGLGLIACGPTASLASTTKAALAMLTTKAPSCSYAAIQPDLFKHRVLTVATDSPAYEPWFDNNTPSNGKGYESAVAYCNCQAARFLEVAGEVDTRAF